MNYIQKRKTEKYVNCLIKDIPQEHIEETLLYSYDDVLQKENDFRVAERLLKNAGAIKDGCLRQGCVPKKLQHSADFLIGCGYPIQTMII